MTKENKELLLEDLRARLPYGVIMINMELPETHYSLTYEDLYNAMVDDDWDDVPYLRPMSSMAEEERVEYCDLQNKFLLSSLDPVTAWHALYDWLNKKMFDYRGLIPKGLAIEVTENNNPYKIKI